MGKVQGRNLMGLFALPLGNTKREHILSLIANCKLWLENPDCDYLFGFMQACLDKAKEERDEKH
jgi:hypothetical protein